MSRVHNGKKCIGEYIYKYEYKDHATYLYSIYFYDDDTATLEDYGALTSQEWLNEYICPITITRRWFEGIKCPPECLGKFGLQEFLGPNFIWCDDCQALHSPIRD